MDGVKWDYWAQAFEFPFQFARLCSGMSTPCSMVLITSPLSKMALSMYSPAVDSAKASPPYFSNSLGIMSVPQAQWFLRVFNARSTSSGVWGYEEASKSRCPDLAD